ncbi:MAG: enoyl-CoA hydratase [Alphaproteobacteria bacterium]
MAQNLKLKYTSSTGIAEIVLDRPDARNALSYALLTELEATLRDVRENPEIRVLVISATGPVFSAGHDLKELLAADDPEFHRQTFSLCSRVMSAFPELPQPIIVQVQGPATAAGCQMVAAADLAVSSTDAKFSTPGVNIGLFCATPMVPISRSVAQKQAMEMLLTGDWIDAPTAKAIGLINQFTAPGNLRELVWALAEKIAAKPRRVIQEGKAAFYAQRGKSLLQAYEMTTGIMVDNMGKPEAIEGISAFLEKRAPNWKVGIDH